mmetsp:Transcript_90846/g.265956  ORF Transcript_90846/g.265956 Transcript_90846/m.265956 type:complete len:351 (+) Transcript_90846:784-1836(+)
MYDNLKQVSQGGVRLDHISLEQWPMFRDRALQPNYDEQHLPCRAFGVHESLGAFRKWEEPILIWGIALRLIVAQHEGLVLDERLEVLVNPVLAVACGAQLVHGQDAVLLLYVLQGSHVAVRPWAHVGDPRADDRQGPHQSCLEEACGPGLFSRRAQREPALPHVLQVLPVCGEVAERLPWGPGAQGAVEGPQGDPRLLAPPGVIHAEDVPLAEVRPGRVEHPLAVQLHGVCWDLLPEGGGARGRLPAVGAREIVRAHLRPVELQDLFNRGTGVLRHPPSKQGDLVRIEAFFLYGLLPKGSALQVIEEPPVPTKHHVVLKFIRLEAQRPGRKRGPARRPEEDARSASDHGS